jgi:hypothetical protein
VDIEAQHRAGQGRIIGQSKYRIRDVATLDTVLSQFSAYEEEAIKRARSEQQNLFAEPPSQLSFVIVTASNLDEIRRRYEEGSLSGSNFYRKLKAAGRLFILDGSKLLVLLQSHYRQSYLITPQIELELSADIIEVGNVRLSVVSGEVLRRLYEDYGSSLFFENIREFLGLAEDGGDRDASVNSAISETLRSQPDKMLGRNNGITFRADSVQKFGERKLRLSGGSIVNGCQTTMCVVGVGEHANQAMIATKIVIGGDSWEVARSANYQNHVTRIDLELARFLRPQVVRKTATDLGFGLPTTPQANISNVLEDIHRTKVSYDAIRLLYIGLFSRHPRNLFDGNYSEVRLDVLHALYEKEKHPYVMRVLFELWMGMERAREILKDRLKGERFIDAFKRFFHEEQLKYQCLLAILTACGCVNDDLVEKSSGPEEARRRLDFITRLEIVLHRSPEFFNRTFRAAFTVIAQRLLGNSDSESGMMQVMYREVTSASGPRFGQMVSNLRIQMLNDDYLAANPPDFSAVHSEG